MAGRKGVVVTESLNSSDELFEFLGRQGLCVLDAYQTWCGPCKPVQESGLIIKQKLFYQFFFQIFNQIREFSKG